MRVWDVHPGYLSRSRLLGQHVEIHAVWSVIVGNREGYSCHPETMRWRGNLPWLKQVHDLTAAEMGLRGFGHKSPLEGLAGPAGILDYIDHPLKQFSLLREKYREQEGGRLVLPSNDREFWQQHQANIYSRGRRVFRGLRLQVKPGPLGPELLEGVIDALKIPLNLALAREALSLMARAVGLPLGGGDLGEEVLGLYRVAREQGYAPVLQASVLTDVLAARKYGGEVP